MAVCGNCGAEVSRIRTRYAANGAQMPDECPVCCPETFERFKSVRDGTIALGHEYMPTMYKKRGDVYVAKDELLADTEAQVCRPPEEEAKYVEALARKRATRRTTPMTPAELEQALRIAHHVTSETATS